MQMQNHGMACAIYRKATENNISSNNEVIKSFIESEIAWFYEAFFPKKKISLMKEKKIKYHV